MFYIENGTLNCKYKNYTIKGLNAKLLYKGNKYNMLQTESGAWEVLSNGKTAISKICCGEFRLYQSKTQGSVSFSVEFIANQNFEPKKCHQLTINGFLPVNVQSLVYNANVIGRVHNFEMGGRSLGTALIKNQKEEGMQYIGFKASVKGRNGYYGYIGFTTFNHYFGDVEFAENGEFSLISTLNDELVDKKIKSDKCAIYIERGNIDVLSHYGKQIAKQNHSEKRVEIPTGWCSWYYYGPNISDKCILENMSYIKKYDLPVKYIQIDDGWQKGYGEWEENENFTFGMKNLADEIKNNGYTPGIWITPFGFTEKSDLFVNHPECFIKLSNGQLHPNRLVDYSHKAAKEWLYNLAKKISYDWGYRYIKIDLVTHRLAINGYEKKGFNALKNFRTAIQVIRSAVTPDTVLLTCTSPIGASAGIADCVRISNDIFERWESLKLVAKEVFRRSFVNEFINIDPDCLMVRTEDKHDDDTFRICTRNETEIKTFINFMSASGGAIMLSDKFALLDDNDIDKIRTLFPINTAPAKPLDLFERKVPSILKYQGVKDFDMYAIFNWENCVDTFEIDLGKERYVKCYYSGEVVKTSKFTLTLNPHDSEIIYVCDDKSAFDKLTTSIMPE